LCVSGGAKPLGAAWGLCVLDSMGLLLLGPAVYTSCTCKLAAVVLRMLPRQRACSNAVKSHGMLHVHVPE